MIYRYTTVLVVADVCMMYCYYYYVIQIYYKADSMTVTYRSEVELIFCIL